MSRLCVIKNDNAKYPRPDEFLNENNAVFQMIREGFYQLDLDSEHFGTKDWSPLKDYVHPGDSVLIKPNMVMHDNPSGEGTDCLFTHPSLVSAMIKYVSIALQGKGRIIVGDAPLQECLFDKLINDSGYNLIIDYYQKLGIDVSLVDFRNVKTKDQDGIHYLQEQNGHKGVLVRVDEQSAFCGITDEHAKSLRITNYDPRILNKHHSALQHEYMIANEVLEADVIINMPKPKTHRKAGITASLKNLVGINANKEYLPHHTLGSKAEGGDAYLDTDVFLSMANRVLDIKNILVNEQEYDLARMADHLYGMLKEKNKDEQYWEGSWYGNDTIWRTIVDLNQILLYADKSGHLRNEKQRRLFIVGDMIVSGEKEGPLEPTPIETQTIVMGEDPVQFDMLVCSLMGFDYHKIPSIEMPTLHEIKKRLIGNSELEVLSNNEDWNRKTLSEIRDNYSFQFMPSRGWFEKLGSLRIDRIEEEIKKRGSTVYVFGAREYGQFIAEELIRRDICIEAFCDNDLELQNKEVTRGIKCISPNSINCSIPILIAVKPRFQMEIEKQLRTIIGSNNQSVYLC